MVSEESIIKVESAIRRLRNKFLKSPFDFYTESAMHCYLYSILYAGETFKRKSRVIVGEGGRTAETVLLHNEYPTLGKFYKQPGSRLLIPSNKELEKAGDRTLKPTRGAFDLAIIEPDEKEHFKHQKPGIVIELALNEDHPELWHLRNDITKITYHRNQVDRGYILYFIRKDELSEGRLNMLPKLREKMKENEKNLDPRVRILYLESPPKDEEECEIHLPSDWSV